MAQSESIALSPYGTALSLLCEAALPVMYVSTFAIVDSQGIAAGGTVLVAGLIMLFAFLHVLEEREDSPSFLVSDAPFFSGGAVCAELLFGQRRNIAIVVTHAIVQGLMPVAMYGWLHHFAPDVYERGGGDSYPLAATWAIMLEKAPFTPLFKLLGLRLIIGVVYVALWLKYASQDERVADSRWMPLELFKMGLPIWIFTYPWTTPSMSLVSFLWIQRVYMQPAWLAGVISIASSLAEAVGGKVLYEWVSMRRLERIRLSQQHQRDENAENNGEAESTEKKEKKQKKKKQQQPAKTRNVIKAPRPPTTRKRIATTKEQ